jgi:hypothetical protein
MQSLAVCAALISASPYKVIFNYPVDDVTMIKMVLVDVEEVLGSK